MERYKFSITSCNKDYWKIRKAITAGYFFHVAKKVHNIFYNRIQLKGIEHYQTIIRCTYILVVHYLIKDPCGVFIMNWS